MIRRRFHSFRILREFQHSALSNMLTSKDRSQRAGMGMLNEKELAQQQSAAGATGVAIRFHGARPDDSSTVDGSFGRLRTGADVI